MKSVKTQILRKAGQNAELYLKLAVGVVPGGSGVLALNALSRGDYAEASLEVFFLVPWLRLAGRGLNHIKIVARNGDNVIVSRQAVEAWQQAVYNGGTAGLKRAEDLGQALKAGGRNADDVVNALGRAGINASANKWGRGLIGIVQPGGTVDSTLRAHYLDIARSPQMAAAIERYNWIARFLRQKPSAGIDDIVKALGNDVTFSRVGHVQSGVFVPGRRGMVVPTSECWYVPATNFWIQGNPTTLYGRRVGRHELVHLGAALRGQGDTTLHEVAVQLATTPENLVAFVGGVFIVVGGQAYWLYFR